MSCLYLEREYRPGVVCDGAIAAQHSLLHPVVIDQHAGLGVTLAALSRQRG